MFQYFGVCLFPVFLDPNRPGQMVPLTETGSAGGLLLSFHIEKAFLPTVALCMLSMELHPKIFNIICYSLTQNANSIAKFDQDLERLQWL